MEFQIPCDCGKSITVAGEAAGTVIDCACGKQISVPSLGALRRQAGLAPFEVDPTLGSR
jgi:hypothetical protein